MASSSDFRSTGDLAANDPDAYLDEFGLPEVRAEYEAWLEWVESQEFADVIEEHQERILAAVLEEGAPF